MKIAVKFYKNHILKDITYFNTKNDAKKYIQEQKRNFTVHNKVKNYLQWHIA